jgi:hypothetical protein
MGIFNDIVNKILGKTTATTANTSVPGPSPIPSPTIQNVDVEAVLKDMAAKKGGGGNYKVSIVDLLKLLGLDSSLNARKKLADELNVHAGEPGTAEQNIALYKAVLTRLAANGGKVW